MKNTRLLFVLSCLSVLVLAGPVYASQAELGPTWETSCTNDVCTSTVYSYEKYWNDDGDWEEIDESFSDCSAEGRTRYCTHPYYFTAQLDDEGTLSINYEGSVSTLRMTGGMGSSRVRSQPSRSSNRVSYDNVLPSVDVVYYHVPHKIKEEIVLNDRPRDVSQEDLSFTFARTGALNEFNLERPYLCDANYNCQTLAYTEEGETITLHLPSDFLMNEETEYPVTIDPTLYLNNSKIGWNGHIYYNGTTYTRFDNPLLLNLWENVNKSYRADIEWNITGIPQGSTVTNITLTLYTETLGSAFDLSVYELLNYSGWYKDNNNCTEGNCAFWNDMGGGKKYGELHIPSTSGTRNISLEGAYTNLEASITSKMFGFGMIVSSNNLVQAGARDNTNVSKRPRLTISYGVNVSDGNTAIEAGINTTLPGNSVTSRQQVYLLNELGQHYLGRFDRTTALNNQTWAFSYLVNGDTAINMPSLFRVLNVWENSSLTYAEIKNQVEVFINATKY